MDERKLATVVFADLVGSTALAHDEDPERVRAVQDRFFDAMAEEIERRGGVVEKYVGDAVMAVFGAPAALEDHAERALHAALAMQTRLGEIGGGLELRIGVSTGEVVAGQARDGGTFVTGDAVNVGARLEQAAAPARCSSASEPSRLFAARSSSTRHRSSRRRGSPEGSWHLGCCVV